MKPFSKLLSCFIFLGLLSCSANDGAQESSELAESLSSFSVERYGDNGDQVRLQLESTQENPTLEEEDKATYTYEGELNVLSAQGASLDKVSGDANPFRASVFCDEQDPRCERVTYVIEEETGASREKVTIEQYTSWNLSFNSILVADDFDRPYYDYFLSKMAVAIRESANSTDKALTHRLLLRGVSSIGKKHFHLSSYRSADDGSIEVFQLSGDALGEESDLRALRYTIFDSTRFVAEEKTIRATVVWEDEARADNNTFRNFIIKFGDQTDGKKSPITNISLKGLTGVYTPVGDDDRPNASAFDFL